jgi:citrate/tricarballylate utilization protein
MTHALQALVAHASSTLDAPHAEGARIMRICNACRYCEGFCAVFPAMTRRLEFAHADIDYLAHLCHGCGACLHACQYAPPHEFAVNVPRTLSQARLVSYADHAWPRAFGRAYAQHGWLLVLVLMAALAGFLLAAAHSGGGWVRHDLDADFYRVFAHGTMVAVFAPVFGFACLALGIGVARFWRSLPRGVLAAAPAVEAADAALRLKYLDGNNSGQGDGCHDASDHATHWRRRFHHATFYGFALCFAATSVATLYHYGFGWVAPYAMWSLPKFLGTTGGVLLCVGTLGLAALKWQRHPLHRDETSAPMDWGLLLVLFATGLTGLALMAVRMTPATSAHTPWLLAVHLACVLAFFATMPYGKFAHGFYRCAALLRYAIERREPLRIKLGAD